MNKTSFAAAGAALSVASILGSTPAFAQTSSPGSSIPGVHLVSGEASEYQKNSKGGDAVVHDLFPPTAVTYSGSLPGGGWNSLNSHEKAQCKSHPAQCVGYYGISKTAINFEHSQASLINKGKTAKDRDDRGQATRHQYWFAMMNAEWGQVPAWEWAIAHEGDGYMKSADSRCDMDNNAKGNIIGVQAGQKLHAGQSAASVKSWIASQVISNINKGAYCRR